MSSRHVERSCMRGRQKLNQTPAFLGVFRYEFAMQLRRTAMWIGLAMISALLFFILGATTGKSANTDTPSEALGFMASGLTVS